MCAAPRYLTLEETSEVVPIAVHLSLFGLLDELGQAPVEFLAIGFDALDIVGANPLVERWEACERRPATRRFKGRDDLRINLEASRAHRRKDRAPGIGHKPESVEPAHTLLVKLRPLPRRILP